MPISCMMTSIATELGGFHEHCDSAKVTDANAGANNAIHIPHNPTLAGLATLTRNVAYKTGGR